MENTETTEVTETTESTKVSTAFIIVKHTNNAYQVVPYGPYNLELESKFNRLDVKQGCSEILDAINRQELVGQFMAALSQPKEASDAPQE
jgi:hypothetical protein